MECPYCNAELAPAVLSCKACGRDVSVVRPLLEAQEGLNAKLSALEERIEQLNQSILTNLSKAHELPIDEANISGNPNVLAIERVQNDHHYLRYFVSFLLGLTLPLLAHFLFVIILDLPLLWLRLISIIIPACAGYLSYSTPWGRKWADALVAVTFAFFSIIGMSSIVSIIDGSPILPSGKAEWKEALLYGSSIAASFFSGIMINNTLSSLKKTGIISLSNFQKQIDSLPKKVQHDTVKTAEMLVILLSTLASGLVAVVSGVFSILR